MLVEALSPKGLKCSFKKKSLKKCDSNTSTHIWVIDTANHSLRPIKDEESGQVSSIACHNNHSEPSPDHAENTGAETTRSA